MGCNATMRCPNCQDGLKLQKGDKHECWKITRRPPNLFPLLEPYQLPQTSTSQKIKIKVPVDDSYTIFKWTTTQLLHLKKNIKDMSEAEVRGKDFQTKLCWFRANLEDLRVSWHDGCDILKVDRLNLLMSSKVAVQKMNLHREIKIQFDDEEVEDAGGLLRQWMHLTIKEIFSDQIAILQLCDTDETAYKIKWDKDLLEDFACEYLEILGIIIGKALFERISLNCYLNRTILRQICRQPVHMHDLFSFDKDFYKQWSYMLSSQNVTDLGLDFCAYHTNKSDNTTDQIELIERGKEIMVTNENKKQYISELIHLYCTDSIEKYIEVLRKGVYKVIPPKYLTIFEPYEFQMMMNGPQEIDVKDWRKYTTYDGFFANQPYIEKFWQIVEGYSQEKRGHLLHYCTGSRGVPIRGFKYLQSNRNTVTRFKIRHAQLNEANPYPKSYTCFNRLELPRYSTLEELKEKLDTIVLQELNNFGLD